MKVKVWFSNVSVCCHSINLKYIYNSRYKTTVTLILIDVFNNVIFQFTFQVKALASIGGSDLADGVRAMMRTLGTNSLWENFTLRGTSQKRRFDQLPLCSVVISEYSPFDLLNCYCYC